ncbi:hormone receptor 4-like isoform X4 [Bolinopsis microptera]|uniref:hormone receptor 4-like isoform X4 n=1 Tax=Bolinopsis microptera TaxID=2820187 RepID=UPI00307B0269
MSKSSLQLVENELIEAREDDSSPWYVARILKVEGRRIFIHYLNWHKRHDQWLPSRSPRIRALSKKNADKLPEEQNLKSVMFKVGQAIEAKWIDKHYYPGTILSAEGNEYYRVLFSDGFKKKLRFSQIRHPLGAVEEPEPEPEPEKEEDTSAVVSVSSRAKRLSARNSDELVSTTRSKRLSARLNRNSSSEPTSRNSSSERSRRDSSPGIITLKDMVKDSETKPSSQPKDSPPKKGSPVKKESPARKESPNKKESQPAKNSSPKTPVMPKKNSPKAESDTKSSHTLIIDDVIEFEVPKKASPIKEKHDFKKEAPTIQIATTPVLKPHKLELTEPEPVPITDTKITKRGHSGCADQRHKRDHSDSKISVVNSKGSRNNKQLDHSKIPIIASEKQDKLTDQKVGEKQAGTDGLKSDLMSDHISQLQRNQRDQSARLIAAKGVKEVVYQTAGYSQAAMMAGLKQGPSGPVYMPHMPGNMPHMPGNMPHMPGMFGTPPYSQYYPVGSAGIASAQQYVVRPPITSGPKLFAETIPSTTSHTNAWGMPGQYAVASSYSPAMSPHHTAGIYVTSQQFVTSSQQHHPSPTIVSPAMQSPGVAISSHPGVAISSHPIASHPGQPQGFPLEFQQRAIPQQIPQSRKTKAASEPSSSPSPSSHMSQSPSSHMSASPSHPSSHISPSPSHPANSPIPHHVTNATGPVTAGTGSGGAQTPPRKLEIAKTDSGKQKRNRREGSSDGSGRKSQKRGPEEPKQVRKIVKKSGNQAEALKKISYDIYDFPVSLTTKASKKTTETTKSKESDLSEESESSAGEESSSAHSTPTHHLPHQIPPPYYVNYPFYPNMQNTKITNPIHQMNMIAQQYHAQNRHHLFQQHMMHPQHKQRGRKSSHTNRSAPQSPSKMRLHNQAIDANTASLLRHHHLTQQQKATGQKVPGQAAPVRYKTPEPVAPASFRGMLESDEVAAAGSPAKCEKSDGQQPQAYLSVMKLDKNKGQGPMIESYPVHGSFKSTVPRAPKLASPKGSQPGSPGSAVSKKTSAPSPSQGAAPQQIIAKPHFNPVTPAQIQKVSNPARLPPGYDMQQQIYRYPQPMGTYPHPGNNPAMFKPVSVPAPVPNTEEKGGQIVQPTPIMSPKPVPVSGQAPDLKPDDSISAGNSRSPDFR